MPRMSLQLNDFSGGLNTKSSPRDIAPNQVQKADNAFLSNPGLIQATSDATSKSTTSPTMTHTKQGNGAFIFNSQYNVDTDGTATQTTQAIAYPINKDIGNSTIQFFRRDFDTPGDSFTYEGTNAEIDMGVDGEVQPVYYFVDGLLYVSDKLVVSGTNSSEPKKLTYIESDRFGQSVSGWQNLPMQIETDTVFTGINEYVSGSEYSAITDAGDFQVVLSSSPTIDSQELTTVKTSVLPSPVNAAVNIVTTTNPDDASPDPYYDIGLTDKIIYVKSLTGAVNLDTDDLDFSTAYSSSTDFENDMVIYINNEAMKILSVSYLDSAGTSDIARLMVQRDIYGVYGGGIEHEGTSQIKVLTSDTDVVTGGGWEVGSYEFCHTFVDLQDNETLPQTPLSTKFDISEGSYFNSVGFRVKYASWTSRKNEKGVRIYTRKSGGNGRWILFLDVDYTFGTHGGIRKNLFEDYQALEDNTSTYKQLATTNLLNIVNPSLDTYESINGYSQDEEDITFGTDGGYKAATVCARRAWVANVRKNDKVYDDRIYYTPVNRFSTFPDSYYLDIGISDGDSFTALHSLGNRLLAFKQRKLYVINISSSSDAGWYLEAEYDGVGCRQQESVCKTPFGVCWVNDDGVYIYDGQGLPKELSVALDDATWRTNQINKNPAIGYNNKYKQLNVVQDTAADTDVFVFDFPTQGWSLTKSIGNSGISNFLPSFDGLYYIEYGATKI
jgi:hypothetical protein